MSKSLPAHDGQFVFPKGVTSWKQLAKLGCFVYVYLRKDGSPYYVGVASRRDRPFVRRGRNALPPSDSARVRVLRSGLTRKEALDWECFYIARYGRKDIGTGILRNLTAGGDGLCELSAEAREKIRQSCLARDPACYAKDEQWKLKVRRANTSAEVAARYGFSFDEWLDLPKSKKHKVRQRHAIAKRRSQKLGDKAENLVGRAARVAHSNAAMAERYGISAEQWSALDKHARFRAHARYRLGHRGAALFVEKLPQPPKPSRSAQHAERYQIELSVWLGLTKTQKATIRDRYIRGITNPAELLDFSNCWARSA